VSHKKRFYSERVTTNVSADGVPIPAEVSELTAEWFSQALDCHVSEVEVLDAHSGTTGRRVFDWRPGTPYPRRCSSNCSRLVKISES